MCKHTTTTRIVGCFSSFHRHVKRPSSFRTCPQITCLAARRMRLSLFSATDWYQLERRYFQRRTSYIWEIVRVFVVSLFLITGTSSSGRRSTQCLSYWRYTLSWVTLKLWLIFGNNVSCTHECPYSKPVILDLFYLMKYAPWSALFIEKMER